jgi:HAD superfamily hydrolase (TIGR01490 family)
MSSKPFAVFDIDGTLIRWQLYHAIVNELAQGGHLAKDAYNKIHTSRMVWKSRSHSASFNEYSTAIVQAYHEALTQLDVNLYLAAIDKVFEEYKDQVYTYTRDLLKSLKKQGYQLFAISGSQQEIIEKLADYYGFDAAIGNTYERKNGKFTGNHEHIVENKAKLLDELVNKLGVDYSGSIGIGDSEGDIELLSKVEDPIAFNPTHELFEHAKKAGWSIIVERKNVIYKIENKDGKYILV